MSDPSLGIQGALFQALRADAAIQSYLGDPARVYDRVPENPDYPYVRIGPGQVVGDDDGCADRSEVTVEAHVWSNDPGFVQCKNLAAEIRRLMKQDFGLDGFRIVLAEFITTRFLDAPDGKTSHAVVEFRYLVDHPLN